MDGTPRLRSAYPGTPRRDIRDQRPPRFNGPPAAQKPAQSLPQAPALKSSIPGAPTSDPLIPINIVDAPSQRLYAAALWVALWTWCLYDFGTLQEEEEQSLWLFMKWVIIDGIFLFGLPALRIPWLEWEPATMCFLFFAHAALDFMLMFRIGLPIGLVVTVMSKSIWGVYEMAVNERNVNPRAIAFNDSLILGRQTIHILPEGSAVLNPERASYCLDQARTEVRLPIEINATNPVSMDILRVDLETQVNETLHISKSQIKTMHKEASRLISYSDNPNEPKTLYYTVKKPGLYALQKVMDESNLEVARKRLAHTIVVPCPRAAILPSSSDRCRGELSNVELEVTGTPPMKVKYRKTINSALKEATFESIQPEDLISPLMKLSHHTITLPNQIETEWARSRSIRVSLSEPLAATGKWAYAIDKVTDGLGNVALYSERDQDEQERSGATKATHLHQVITVHDRPHVELQGCTPQKPLKVAKGQSASLPLKYSSTAGSELANSQHHLEYLFTAQDDISANGEHGSAPQRKSISLKNIKQLPQIQEPGLYTLTGVTTDFCKGDILEPASCLLQNPPEPSLSISQEEMFDKCAGSPIGLRVDLDLIGTPPFEVFYRWTNTATRHHEGKVERLSGLRGQLELLPPQAGEWTYDFYQISDAVYKNQPLKGLHLKQSVKPSASARFKSMGKKITCIDEKVGFQIDMQGEAPFAIEYEQIHGGRRTKYSKKNITAHEIELETEPLKDGGDYTLALVSITDRVGCKEFLKDEMKITVRHQKPKVSFGQLEGRRSVDTLEGQQVSLPLRLAGEAPWKVKYLDQDGNQQTLRASNPNERLVVDQAGTYQLLDVSDAICPGVVDEPARDFKVEWIPRPAYRIPPGEVKDHKGSMLFKDDVCEGDEDSVEVLFKGSPPYIAHYVQQVKLDHGTVAPKPKELSAAVNVASLRMDTSRAGLYEYKFSSLDDANYKHSPKHFAPLSIQQRVHARPTVAFTNPGKTYSFCSVESEGEEVIPITLQGQPPFDIEVEIKHHGAVKSELVHYNNINTKTHTIRIPHSRLHLGKSSVSLRRVSDSRGCSRSLDSTAPPVQISVHNAPTITPLEVQEDYCVGERLNFGLSGVAPFTVFYNFEGYSHKASVSSGSTFRRFAEKPGQFSVTGLQDGASHCRASTNITKHIHGLPSVRVSKGKDSYVDIHEGGQAEILFEFGGTPPFEFTYTRSSNTEKGGRKGVLLDMRSEVSDEHSMRVWASEEGTYEVVRIKDRYCSYSKPGVKFDKDQKRLLY